MDKKPAVFFSVASKEYFKYAVPFWRSMTKFHSPKDVDMILYTNMTDKTELAKLPKGIILKDLTPFLNDPNFYFRQKPVVSEPLLDEYELVVGFDADSLILGSLEYIVKTKDYDCFTVINWNRSDEKVYPLVGAQGIFPAEYFNCGLVGLRSKKFAHHWKVLCYQEQFNRLQYREQDLLNILCYYGNYNIRCGDHGDPIGGMVAWWGIIGKGEWYRSILKDKKIIVPKGEGDTPFPARDTEIKVATLGGGAGAIKDNWSLYFPSEVMVRINELIK